MDFFYRICLFTLLSAFAVDCVDQSFVHGYDDVYQGGYAAYPGPYGHPNFQYQANQFEHSQLADPHNVLPQSYYYPEQQPLLHHQHIISPEVSAYGNFHQPQHYQFGGGVQYNEPTNIVIDTPVSPVNLIYRSMSNPVEIHNQHISTGGTVKYTTSYDEPHVHRHVAIKPVKMEIHEIVTPLRYVKQSILPVQEEIHTEVSASANHQPIKENLALPVSAPLLANGGGHSKLIAEQHHGYENNEVHSSYLPQSLGSFYAKKRAA